mmetsp:Transcript_23649/g.33101  ORF Transcript_23649/g.33101 Transcript_23649/m.33101 type:complete len:177 (+) Transcript_23649:91-621(+)
MEAQFEDMFGLGSQAPQGPKKKKRARQKSPSQRKKGKKSKRVKDKDKDKDKDKERKHEQKIIERMTDEQKARHEKYTSEKLDKDYIEGILQSLMKNGGKEERLGKTKDDLKILKLVVRDITEMFIEEIVEESRKVMAEFGDTGPIRPIHMREAHRRIQSRKLSSNLRTSGRLFTRR